MRPRALRIRYSREIDEHGSSPVPGDDVGVMPEDEHRVGHHRIQQPLQTHPKSRARGRLRVFRRMRQSMQVRRLVRVEVESARDRVEDLRGDILAVALFQPGVVGHAHAYQLSELLPAQPRHSPLSAMVHYAHVLGPQPGAPRFQKLTQFSTYVHITRP